MNKKEFQTIDNQIKIQRMRILTQLIYETSKKTINNEKKQEIIFKRINKHTKELLKLINE